MKFFARQVIVLLFTGMVMVCTLAAAEKTPTTQGVPDPQARTQAAAAADKILKTKLTQAKTPQQKTDLINEITKMAGETNDDPALKYALFDRARMIAIGLGDVRLTMSVIDQTGRYFNLDMKAKADALGSLQIKPDQLDGLMEWINQAIRADDYVTARRLVAMGVRYKDKRFTEKMSAINAIVAESAKIKTLNTKDPQAGLAIGKFYFLKGDWENGLKAFAKCEDQDLKTLATRSLLSKPSVDLADQWWDYAGKTKGTFANQIKIYTATLYKEILPSLSGAHKTDAEQKIGHADELENGRVERYTVWSRDKVKQKDTLWLLKNGEALDQLGEKIITGKWTEENGKVTIIWDNAPLWGLVLVENGNKMLEGAGPFVKIGTNLEGAPFPPVLNKK